MTSGELYNQLRPHVRRCTVIIAKPCVINGTVFEAEWREKRREASESRSCGTTSDVSSLQIALESESGMTEILDTNQFLALLAQIS